MDDALLVRDGEAKRDLLTRSRLRRAAGVDQTQQRSWKRPALEQLRNNVGGPIVGADVVDRDDVRMIQRRGRERLAFESAAAGPDRPTNSSCRTLTATSRRSVVSNAR